MTNKELKKLIIENRINKLKGNFMQNEKLIKKQERMLRRLEKEN